MKKTQFDQSCHMVLLFRENMKIEDAPSQFSGDIFINLEQTNKILRSLHGLK